MILNGVNWALVCVILLTGCGYHPPSPVEEQSSDSQTRKLVSKNTYYVRPGDTLYGIAFNHNVDARNLAKWNAIPSPYVIYPGQKIRLSAPPINISDGHQSADVEISTVKSPGQATTKVVTEPPASKQVKATPVDAKPSATISSKPVSTAKAGTSVKAPVSTTADPESWIWPTKGAVLRSYVAGDPSRNGLDIAGKTGQAIIASSGGQVVYSGNGLIGYGELIIIKHSEKMLSAYAHNKIRLVQEGELVSSGQKIAEMGRNAADEQILHFEIRARGKPVNPSNYLPKK